MADVSISNTTTQVSGKTVVIAENDQTVTGLQTFDRDPSAPFAVSAASAVVPNLDADKLDGFEGAAFLQLAGGTMTGDLKFTDALYDIGKSGATRPRDLFLSRLLDLSGTAAGQIKFPATQNAATDVNTLDDYEEGTWVPVIGGAGGTSGQVYSTQVGRYVKIGQLVVCWFNAVLSTKGTITGAVQIQGLPFTSNAATTPKYVSQLEWNDLNTAWIRLGVVVAASVTVGTIQGITVAAVSSQQSGLTSAADILNTSNLMGTIMYQATA